MRLTLRSKPPDQRPILQSDHSPIVLECPLFTGESVQFSSGVDTERQQDQEGRQRTVQWMGKVAMTARRR
jgi:hypothetical protein